VGSKNGTFLNGRRIDQSELHVGDEIRFGTIPCTFGIGNPDDFAAPVPVDEDQDDQFTRAMEMEEFDDDASFEFHGDRKKSDTLFNVLAVLIIAGLGGLAFVLSQHKPNLGDGSDSGGRSDNLLPAFAWSFEVPDESEQGADDSLSWEKLAGQEGADMELVTDGVKSGSFALTIEGTPATTGPTLVVLRHPLTVSGGSAYRVSVEARGSGAIPVVGLAWFSDVTLPDGTIQEAQHGASLVYGPAATSKYATVSGIVLVPDGASRGRFAVGSASKGSVTFDDAHLQTDTLPESRSTTLAGTRALVSSQASLYVSRYGRPLIVGMGISEGTGDTIQLQDSLVVGGESEANRFRGTLRGGRGELAASLSHTENSITVPRSGFSSLSFPEVRAG
jgi:hypothetical protein